jgi:hydrogenase maturation protease
MSAAARLAPPGGAHTLLLGWGNPGRRDDGLGPALVAELESRHPPGVCFDSDYQLQVEDAAEVALYERVVFVDADRAGGEPFSIRRIRPDSRTLSFSTHSVRPEAVLALARSLFEAEPEAWLVGVHGYDFDSFGEGLSDGARANLAAAAEALDEALRRRVFHEFRGARRKPAPASAGSTHLPDSEDDPCQTPSP